MKRLHIILEYKAGEKAAGGKAAHDKGRVLANLI